jgi:hypothetical protein
MPATFAEKREGTVPVSDSVTKVEAAISELVAAFPATFTLDPKLVRPVKLGIKNDLYGQSAFSRRRITAALRAYCNSAPYLTASIEGTVRIDLAGEPAGAVTATEARHAREALSKSSGPAIFTTISGCLAVTPPPIHSAALMGTTGSRSQSGYRGELVCFFRPSRSLSSKSRMLTGTPCVVSSRQPLGLFGLRA